MEKYREIIKGTSLFADIDLKLIEEIWNDRVIKVREHQKGEYIIEEGDLVKNIFLLLSGGVQVVRDDYWGNRTIMAGIQIGDIFGEAYACLGFMPSKVSALSTAQSTVAHIDYKRISEMSKEGMEVGDFLIRNLMKILAMKNTILISKIEHMTKPTTREKVLSYLSEHSMATGKPKFTIPFNRQEMADYLSVDRSAMSKELCRLRDEGIIAFQKNKFVLFK